MQNYAKKVMYSETKCAKRQQALRKEGKAQIQIEPWEAAQAICSGFQQDFTEPDKRVFKTNSHRGWLNNDDLSDIIDALRTLAPHVNTTWLTELVDNGSPDHSK